jgi:hypothetical protein
MPAASAASLAQQQGQVEQQVTLMQVLRWLDQMLRWYEKRMRCQGRDVLRMRLMRGQYLELQVECQQLVMTRRTLTPLMSSRR